MGVYIPNMEKPKSCGECDLWSNCFYPKNPYTEQDDYIAPDCSLIDIVKCKDCKWLYKYEEELWCGVWGNATKEDVFCSYGRKKKR